MLAFWTFYGFCIPEIGRVGKWELMGGKLYSNNNNIYYLQFHVIGLSPGGSGYFTCKQIWKESN